MGNRADSPGQHCPRATSRDGLRGDIAIKDIFCDCKAMERAVRHEWEGMTVVARLDGCLGCRSAYADPYDEGMGLHYMLTMGYGSLLLVLVLRKDSRADRLCQF